MARNHRQCYVLGQVPLLSSLEYHTPGAKEIKTLISSHCCGKCLNSGRETACENEKQKSSKKNLKDNKKTINLSQMSFNYHVLCHK